MSAQNELYQAVILDHNRNPRNYSKLEDATHSAEGFNPLCGDHLWVYLHIDSTEKIVNITFEGDGCAISKASASLMTTALLGKGLDEAAQMIKEFQQLVKGELNPEVDEHCLGKLKIFSGIWRYPSRVKCANLAWHAVKGAMNNNKSVTTE
ncbi:MAG: SUF system NifU family Fe-S cluster assembly protein [Zetaproteobacteria bacterium]|nr:SUF system NifU family Fe-S cluster assembly protein [Pseudobdellovibrionaceae bacterium]